MADWYYAVNDQQRGPVTQDRLAGMIAAGQIAPTDLVWTDGMGTWAPAAQVPGLVPAGVAGPLRAGRAAAEEEFPKSRGLWADLSPGAKVGILTGTGGGLVAILFAIIVTVVGQFDRAALQRGAAGTAGGGDQAAPETGQAGRVGRREARDL